MLADVRTVGMGARVTNRLVFEREFWQQGLVRVAGVDEAGRGPLAGPVMAAAVVLPQKWLECGIEAELEALNDSKQLTAGQRDRFYERLTCHPDIQWAVASVEAELIDQINILQATHRAMNLALAQLRPPPEYALVDGRPVPSLSLPQTALIKGDGRSYSIAAASVLAKVTRDRVMLEFDRLYPAYGFAGHKGYPTPRHLAALAAHGPCPIHRRTFAPLRPVEQDLFAAPSAPAAGG